MANVEQDLDVARFQFDRLAPGLIGEIDLPGPPRSDSIFKPDLGLARELLGQFFIDRQGLGEVEIIYKLPGFVEFLVG